MNNSKINFAFFGVGPLAESVLYALSQNNFLPSLVITTPNKASGRNMEIQKNIIATWCEIKNIKCLQLEKGELIKERFENDFDIFVVASYPKILSEEILNIPKYGCLNIHPSLLPKYRGPSPIQTALLNGEEKTAVTIIKLDKEMDHGPILIQQEIKIANVDTNLTLEKKCGNIGGEMLSQILEIYINQNESFKLIEQDHSKATFTKKFTKLDGEINLETITATELQNKFKALLPHIPIYFFVNHKDKNTRVKITEINLDKNFAITKMAKDIIKKLIPENKSEMSFEDFERGYLK